MIQDLVKKNLITPPKWLPDNTVYQCIMGSVAYGVSADTSDMDVYGICIPPKDEIFPHLKGNIIGFDQYNPFEQYQQHHIFDKNALNNKGRTYDFTIYNIVKFFKLAMENNPNIIDSLFVSRECILSSTQVGELIRENRKLFLHKGLWAKFKGYAYSQLQKMRNQTKEGNRTELIERYGYDIKNAYHLVRLLYEAEMLLIESDMDLRRHNEHLKSIRRGDFAFPEIIEWAQSKEKSLENIYIKSELPNKPQVDKIKNLLINCLETHYGSVDIVQPNKYELIVQEIRKLVN